MLLDGHFVLLDKEGLFVLLDVEVFETLNLSAVVLIEAQPELVASRVRHRDGLDRSPEWLAEFNVGELQGQVTLGISLDYTAELAAGLAMNGATVWPDFALTLAFHEGFHFLSDQNDWNTPNGSRNAPYDRSSAGLRCVVDPSLRPAGIARPPNAG